MFSKVQICNMALIHLGRDPSITDSDTAFTQTPSAEKLAASYEIVLPAAMARHPWNFCTRQAQLPAESKPPAFGFAYRYRIPAEPRCLRVWNLDPASHGVNARWKRYGAFIHCDLASPININYIAFVDDPQEFDPQFAQVLALELAAACSYSIAGVDGASFLNAAANLRRDARTFNGQESEEQPGDDQGDWLDSRSAVLWP